jgi:hypothetical protein
MSARRYNGLPHPLFRGERIQETTMGWLSKLFGGREEPKDSGPEPFMEHPTGDHKSAVVAMEDAIRRLRALPNWDQWITFSAQGDAGGAEGEDKYEFAEVKMLRDKLDVGEKPLDLAAIMQPAGTRASLLVKDGPYYSIAAASPREAAQILDAIFRHHFGIRPFADENNDYAVGAEW